MRPELAIVGRLPDRRNRWLFITEVISEIGDFTAARPLPRGRLARIGDLRNPGAAASCQTG